MTANNQIMTQPQEEKGCVMRDYVWHDIKKELQTFEHQQYFLLFVRYQEEYHIKTSYWRPSERQKNKSPATGGALELSILHRGKKIICVP
jgi:hypothetical protein